MASSVHFRIRSTRDGQSIFGFEDTQSIRECLEGLRMKTALITGVTGQDGSYLSELLLDKGYEVHGVHRRSSSFNTGRVNHIFGKLHMHFGDLTDGSSISKILSEVQPEEIYSLGAQSHVRVSFDTPEFTANVGALGTLRLLEAARALCPYTRIYNAGSSEMYGSTPPPQN